MHLQKHCVKKLLNLLCIAVMHMHVLRSTVSTVLLPMNPVTKMLLGDAIEYNE